MPLPTDGVDRKTRFLQPGQLVVSTEPMQITTILGSCVAVCLWDLRLRIGGLNHFMLPHYSGSGTSSPRFGNVAMVELLAGMRAIGAKLPFLQARVFGGAAMFAHMQTSDHLGQKNADLALDFLARNGVEIVQVDTGGNRGRKLVYRTDEGSTCLTSI
jgi:chemotaxis protein CheD